MNKSWHLLFCLIVLLEAWVVNESVAAGPAIIEIQILAVNDFHGNLDPPAGSSGRIGSVNAGGVEFLATHINQLRAQNPRTVVVSAGDLIGASPLLSALFHDEPTIEAFNMIGLDLNAVGNHEFDEGTDELLRMQNGGCHPVDGCVDGDPFEGASFQFLAANVVRESNGKTLFPAYKIRSFAGVKIAFIGMTLEGTPDIVTPSGVAGFDFLDEADTVNALIPELKSKGVEAIIVLIHEGGIQASPAPFNGCVGISGPILDIVDRFDDEVDVVISGHSHQAYNCVIDNKIVTSAASFGRIITDVDLELDRNTGEVINKTATNYIVTRDVTQDPSQSALITEYRTLSAPLANRIIGSITADITNTNNAAGESALGDVIADAQLHATSDPQFGGAVFAFMNPGGIRASLTFASGPVGEGDGNVTYGEAFTVQPFGNSLVTMSLTGAQIEILLEQQFVGCPNNPPSNRMLQFSNGFSYSWSLSGPPCDKVNPADIKWNGVPVVPGQTYRVTVNSFLADGGDQFPILTQGTNRLGGAVDLDALEVYLTSFSPVSPGPQNRITQLP